MAEPDDLAAVIGTARYRLPPGSTALAALPAIRPLPGAAPPLRGMAAHGGEVVPVLVPGRAATPTAWAHLPAPFALLLGAEALLPAGPEDPPLPAGLLVPGPALTPPAPAATAAPCPVAVPRRAVAATARALRLSLGPCAMDLPLAAVLRIVPRDALQPVPGAPGGALGLATTAVGEALVLDPSWLAAAVSGASAGAGPTVEASLLAVFEHAGARLALPCDRAAPGEASEAARVLAALAGPALRRLLGQAPRALPPQRAPEAPLRSVLVARAGGTRFALPVERVDALLAARAPDRPPPGAAAAIRGLCAHRGAVLPVLDGATWLGSDAAPAPEPRPMLRLAVAPPVALQIDALPELRHLPAAGFTPVADPAGLLESVGRLDGAPLPVCRAEAIAALAGGPLPAGGAG